jgi:hypothetical protein
VGRFLKLGGPPVVKFVITELMTVYFSNDRMFACAFFGLSTAFFYAFIFQDPVLSLPTRSILPLILSALIIRLTVLKLIFRRSAI